MGNFEQALTFLKTEYAKSEYFAKRPWLMEYRINHSIRVSNIGKHIAICEHLNSEAVAIGCLLHDIGFAACFEGGGEADDHGRISARLARPFLQSIGYDEELVQQVCYGIALHVDDKADFEGIANPLSYAIVAADSIDRFDVYRIYQNMERIGFSRSTLEGQIKYVARVLKGLRIIKTKNFMTRTANKLWEDRISFQIKFYNRLLRQLQNSYLR